MSSVGNEDRHLGNSIEYIYLDDESSEETSNDHIVEAEGQNNTEVQDQNDTKVGPTVDNIDHNYAESESIAESVIELLPKNYDYKILNARPFGSAGISTVVRLKINTKEKVLSWLDDFQEKNNITLRVSNTHEENTQRLLFKKAFRCSYNTKPKKGSVPRPKNTNCMAKVIVTLKNPKMKRSKDIDLKMYPCEIYLRHIHNHPLNKPSEVKSSKELEYTFKILFENGHSPLSALNIFKDHLLKQYGPEKYKEIMTDEQKCPTQKWVSSLYYSCFKKDYGEPTRLDVVESLKASVNEYNKKCGNVCAAINNDERHFVLAICSPIMKRVHEHIKASSEVMFVDSSASMEWHNTRVFLFLCPSCVGALPLGVVFVYPESDECITKALNLLKTILPSTSFYGCGFPNVIITNDVDTERTAIQNSFTDSKVLLCKSRVLISTKRYLSDPKHGLNEKERDRINSLFHKAINSPELEDFIDQYKGILNLDCVLSNPDVLRFFQNLHSTARSWAVCYRKDEYTTRGNNTNSGVFRMLREKILMGTKVFSILQLFDIFTTSYEYYYFKKIVDALHGRGEKSQNKNKHFFSESKLGNLVCEDLGGDLYRVEANGKEYVVNSDLQNCSCPVGKTGIPCKHQFAVVKRFNLQSQLFYPTSDDNNLKDLLHKVATGKDRPENGCYADITETDLVDVIQKTLPTDLSSNEEDADCENDSLTCNEIGTVQKQLDDMFEEIMQKYKEQPEEYQKPIQEFIKHFNRCKTDGSLIYALRNFGMPALKTTVTNKSENNQANNNFVFMQQNTVLPEQTIFVPTIQTFGGVGMPIIKGGSNIVMQSVAPFQKTILIPTFQTFGNVGMQVTQEIMKSKSAGSNVQSIAKSAQKRKLSDKKTIQSSTPAKNLKSIKPRPSPVTNKCKTTKKSDK